MDEFIELLLIMGLGILFWELGKFSIIIIKHHILRFENKRDIERFNESLKHEELKGR